MPEGIFCVYKSDFRYKLKNLFCKPIIYRKQRLQFGLQKARFEGKNDSFLFFFPKILLVITLCIYIGRSQKHTHDQ